MINSHYIPQFILRNFYLNDKITYCDLNKKTIGLRNTRSVFSEEGYYPERIEKDLCKKAEYLFANLYHNKLENARNTIILTREELFILKKYLVVCAVRYKFELTEEEKELNKFLGSAFEIDYDRCLNEILACETIDEMFALLLKFEKYLQTFFDGKDLAESNDANIRLWSELKDIVHSYIIFVETREEEFIIPDIGRGVYQGPLGIAKISFVIDLFHKTNDPQIAQVMHLIGPRDYTIYPLSKNMAVISMSAFYKLLANSESHNYVKRPDENLVISSFLGFADSNIITPPNVRTNGNDREYFYDIKNLTTKDICNFNSLMIVESKRYIACADLNKIQKSIESAKGKTKRDLSFLTK